MHQSLTLTPEIVGRAIDRTTLNKALVFIIAVAAAGFFFDSFGPDAGAGAETSRRSLESVAQAAA